MIAASAREQEATATEVAAARRGDVARLRPRRRSRAHDERGSAAEESAGLAGQGQAGLTRMEATMRQVMDASGSINHKLAVLNEKAGNINHVVTTITKVADQTNLLSLNAAIEAEKAGEYGRGFAVVATEIRRLADQTAVATYDIDRMVKEIQSAVSAGVMGMDKFSDEVRRGMHEIEQVSGQLTQIIHQVQRARPRCEAVTEGMQAQATGAGQDHRGAVAAERRGAADGSIAAAVVRRHRRLNQAATSMHGGVSRFSSPRRDMLYLLLEVAGQHTPSRRRASSKCAAGAGHGHPPRADRSRGHLQLSRAAGAAHRSAPPEPAAPARPKFHAHHPVDDHGYRTKPRAAARAIPRAERCASPREIQYASCAR
jgi:hypothetical protein